MITSRRTVVADLNAEALSVPWKQLMESSGSVVARACRDLADPGTSVVVAAGRSNNGDDALVVARFLKAHDVTVHLLGRSGTISTDIARENWDALAAGEADRRTATDSTAVDLGDPDLVVDVMLDTDIIGTFREPEAMVACVINESPATVPAVDVPSDVDADAGDAAGLAVDADRAVIFHDDKPGLGDLDCEVVAADIGILEATESFIGSGDLLALDRDAQSHKGDHGDVLVVGGSPYTGAPVLAAQSALRAGVDLARVACPEGVAREVQGYSENLIVRGFLDDRLAPKHVPGLLDSAADRDVIVFGPGLGDADELLDAVRESPAVCDGTAVVDADILRVVPEVETEATLICTPHQGELRETDSETGADREARSNFVRELVADLGHAPLVKGAYDVVSDGDVVHVNRTGDPDMTVGSTGDVLVGTTGASAAVLPPFDAAIVAAYANGRADDFVADEFGGSLVAINLLERLPAGLRGDDE